MRLFSDLLQLFLDGAAMTAPLIVCALLATYVIEAVRGRFRDNWPLPSSTWSCAIAVVVMGFPLGFWTQGSFWGVVLPYITVTRFIAPCLGLLGAVALVFVIRTRRVPRKLWTGALLLTACLPALALSYEINVGMNQWEIDSARVYVTRALPILDDIERKTGAYPDALPVATLGAPPKLLQGKGGYTSDGKTFTFFYEEPGAWLAGGRTFESKSREWTNEWFVD